jgi:hypothetical protein
VGDDRKLYTVASLLNVGRTLQKQSVEVRELVVLCHAAVNVWARRDKHHGGGRARSHDARGVPKRREGLYVSATRKAVAKTSHRSNTGKQSTAPKADGRRVSILNFDAISD